MANNVSGYFRRLSLQFPVQKSRKKSASAEQSNHPTLLVSTVATDSPTGFADSGGESQDNGMPMRQHHRNKKRLSAGAVIGRREKNGLEESRNRSRSSINPNPSSIAAELSSVDRIKRGTSPSSSVASGGSAAVNGGGKMGSGSKVTPFNNSVGTTAVWYIEDNTTEHIDGSAGGDGLDLESLQSSSGEPSGDFSEDERGKLNRKIQATRERLKKENLARENDVDEYIKLTQGLPITSDNPQLMRIRQVFEKKNKKHSQLADQLQKKLEVYNQRLQNLESGYQAKKLGRDSVLTNVGQGLKDMGANLKGTITDYTGSVISVPKDLASKLKHKAFGSADNLQAVAGKADVMLGSPCHLGVIRPPDGPRSLHEGIGGRMDQSGGGSVRIRYNGFSPPTEERTRALSADQASTHSDRSREGANSDPFNDQTVEVAQSVINSFYGAIPQVRLDPILAEIRAIKDKQDRVQESIEELRNQMQQEYAYFSNVLHEEKYRYQRLEDQMNDTVELHQAEVSNLKQEIQNLGARLQYQNDERFRDIQDLFENSQNRVAKLELQTQSSQSFGGPEGINAFALRGMNILILILQFILVLTTMIAHMVQPFLRSRTRAALALSIGLFLFLLWKSGLVSESISRFSGTKFRKDYGFNAGHGAGDGRSEF